MKRVLILLFAVFVTFCASGQTLPEIEQGLKPFGSYHGGNVDVVNLATGNVTVTIPFLSYPQRGNRITLDYSLVYNNKSFAYIPVCDPNLGCYNYWDGNDTSFGYGMQVLDLQQATLNVGTVNTNGDPNYPDWVTYYQVVSADGSTHDTAQVGNSSSTVYRSADTTGYLVNTNGPLMDRSGIAYTGGFDSQNQIIYSYKTDSNGNYITVARPYGSNTSPPTLTDTLGRTMPALRAPTQVSGDVEGALALGVPTSDYTSCTGPLPIVAALVAQMPAYTTTAQYKFCYVSVPISTNFHVFDPNNPSGDYPEYGGTWEMLQSIVLPNGTAWTFQYNSSSPGDPAGTNYGDLTQITFPTGGTLSYTYTNGGGCHSESRSVATRTLNANDGTGPHTWTYAYTPSQTTTVTDPLGNDTVHNFTDLSNCSYYETSTSVYQGSHTSGAAPLKSVTDTYSSSYYFVDVLGLSQTELAYNVMKTAETTSWVSGSTNENQYQYENDVYVLGYLANHSISAGRQTLESRSDFGTGTPPILQQVSTTYESEVNGNYLSSNLLDLPSSIIIKDGNGNRVAETDYGYDDPNLLTGASIGTQHSSSPGSERGNVTSKTQWIDSSRTAISSTNWYDTGVPYQTTDPRYHATTYSYSGFAGAYPTQTCRPQTGSISHCVTGNYDFNSGLLVSYADENSQPYGFIYDNLSRLLSATYPDGGKTTFNYNGDPTPPHVTRTVTATPNSSVVTDYFLDGLGRLAKTELTSDPEGADFTETTYDALGNVLTESNPHRSASNSTDGTTCNGTLLNSACVTGYDALGRLTSITRQDGNTVQTNYLQFPTITFTDEAQKQIQTVQDALGRITDVYEPNPSTGSLTSGDFHTNYQYTALGDLQQVNQYGDGSGATRVRLFDYDYLSRLLDANNPETGFVCYGTMSGSTCNHDGYDPNGNLLYKTDARGFLTSSLYDELNRITQSSYSDGTPTESWIYDVSSIANSTGTFNSTNPIGRLIEHSNNINAGSFFAYDAMGRIIKQNNCTPSSCGVASNPISAQYDVAGHLMFVTYPSGRKVGNSYSAAGRLTQVGCYSDCTGGGTPYYYSASYPDGRYYPNGSIMGATIGAGDVEGYTLNKRLQVTRLTDGPSTYSFLPPNAWLNNNYSLVDSSGHNNGNVMSIAGWPGAPTETFQYDWLNRITAASKTDQTINQTFSYDPWGNLQQSGTWHFVQNFDSNNRISPNTIGSCANSTQTYCYDSAGNLIWDTFHTYIYDAKDRIKTVDSGTATYTYDAPGNRVRKDINGGHSIEYVYFGGHVIDEHDLSTNVWSDYIYADNHRVARVDNYQNEITLGGNMVCSSTCGSIWAYLWITNFGSAYGNPYVVKYGDCLAVAQYAVTSGTSAGFAVWFTDGTSTLGYYDAMNQRSDAGTITGYWYSRALDLSNFAGKTVLRAGFVVENTFSGPFTVYYRNFVIASNGGTFTPLFTPIQLSLPVYLSANPASRAYYAFGLRGDEADIYYHQDHLGTSRVLTGWGGFPIWQGEFGPFGEELNPQTTSNHYKFTGKERDSESNLDYFGARYMSSGMGRFMTPDWSAKEDPVPYAKLDDPQTLNLYSYVRNNPLSNVDADGHACSGVLGNTGSGFCTRATEYGKIDANPTVQSQTRFFAAADAVSQALADVDAPGASLIGRISGKTASFLEGVGQKLQTLNEDEAQSIATGNLSGPGLDQQLVHNEQTVVQGQLDALKQSNPDAYNQRISEINRALNPGDVVRFASSRFPTDAAYAGILDSVRKGLGRNIDFSKQSDREAIGNALVKHIRQTGGCDVNGIRQPGCK